MKVIFLDHDGVICLPNEWGGRAEKIRLFCVENNLEYSTSWNTSKVPMDVRMDDFDTESIKVLNEILKETDAEIIISSDWKKHGTLEEIQEMYKARGVIKLPIAVTESFPSFQLESARVSEIQNFLFNHPEITKWVAVDDMDLSKLENFVRTKSFVLKGGIKGEGVKERIIEFLK
jgi:hypothetical protein